VCDGLNSTKSSIEDQPLLKGNPIENRVKTHQLDNLPLASDLTELKAFDLERKRLNPSPQKQVQNMKRDLSPLDDDQDSESQESFHGCQQEGTAPEHQDGEYLQQRGNLFTINI